MQSQRFRARAVSQFPILYFLIPLAPWFPFKYSGMVWATIKIWKLHEYSQYFSLARPDSRLKGEYFCPVRRGNYLEPTNRSIKWNTRETGKYYASQISRVEESNSVQNRNTWLGYNTHQSRAVRVTIERHAPTYEKYKKRRAWKRCAEWFTCNAIFATGTQPVRKRGEKKKADGVRQRNIIYVAWHPFCHSRTQWAALLKISAGFWPRFSAFTHPTSHHFRPCISFPNTLPIGSYATEFP